MGFEEPRRPICIFIDRQCHQWWIYCPSFSYFWTHRCLCILFCLLSNFWHFYICKPTDSISSPAYPILLLHPLYFAILAVKKDFCFDFVPCPGHLYFVIRFKVSVESSTTCWVVSAWTLAAMSPIPGTILCTNSALNR